MAGNASNADDDELPNLDDNEAENESTVAMEAPNFDRGSAPLPVSDASAKPAEAKPPVAVPPADASASAAAAPPRTSSARTPAAPPAKAPGLPARPAFAAAPPKVAGGIAAGKPGKQTVIGLAPPAARPTGTSPGPRVPVAVPKPASEAAVPAPEQKPAPAPAASSGRSAFAATFPSPYSRAPVGSADSSKQNDASTVTVPKDVLDRVRANPKAVLGESEKKIPKIQHDDDDDDASYEETKLAEAAPAAPANQAPRKIQDDDEDYEETKAVPREELLRQQDAHVVVGADASGDDATLAVPPSANEAALLNSIGAAIGESLQHPPGVGHGGGPPPQYQPPHQPPHGGMGGTMGMPGPQPWSSGQLPVAPRVPGGTGSYGGAPMMGPQGGLPRGQGPTNWAPLQGAHPPARRISGQMILLLIVGFICLAIFVTGIVLFATTKF
jgi:hypothetical protein